MKQMIRCILYFLKKAIVLIAGLTFSFFAFGFILSSIPVNTTFAQTSSDGAIELFITSNGVHTDIIVPVVTPYMDWRTKIPLQHFENVDSSYAYLGFGWGDRRFYMATPAWKDLRPGVAISSALWPTRSAMHTAYIKHKLIANKHQRPILVTPAQYKSLIKYIEQSFQQQNKQFIHIGHGYTYNDTFYEANGKFYLLKNCNNWVNQGLKAMGVKTALWAPFPYAIMRHLR